jgi:hypothetical protein
MKMNDMKTLAAKLVEQIQKSNAEQLYRQFLQVLVDSLRNDRQQSVSQMKDQLFSALHSFDNLLLTHSEAHLFGVLGYKEYVGKSAVREIEMILCDENCDPQGRVRKIDAKQKAFQRYFEKNRNLQLALQQVPKVNNIALR